MSFGLVVKPMHAQHIRLHPAILSRGQIFRAICVGLLFALIFLWGLPQAHLVLTGISSATQRSMHL
jgi:hypothetical protein